jgi:type II secretory pathway component PulC
MLITLVVILGILIVSYYIYRKIKKNKMIKKDYNRKFSSDELKTRNDLSILRKELFKSTDPTTKNELLNKIDAIVNAQTRKGGYEK